MSNISEGFERNNDNELHRFLSYTKGSSGKLRSQLYVALDAGLIEQEDFDDLYERCLEVSRMPSRFVQNLRP